VTAVPDDSDEDVRALFHRIDDGPPIDIDVREVMAHGRHIRTRRTRLAVASSAFAVVAAAALVGLSMGGGDATAPDLRPATSPPPPPTTSSTTGPPPPATNPVPPVTAPTNGPETSPDVPGATTNTAPAGPQPGASVPSMGGGGSGQR
jgi:hypothetical protein